MAELRNYDPNDVFAIFSGHRIRMLMDGTPIEAEKTEDTFTVLVGINGDGTRSRTRNGTGTATIRTQHSSPSNDILSAIHQEDLDFGSGIRPLMIKDNNGTTLLDATQAWVMKMPKIERSNVVSPVEWVFTVFDYNVFVGGSLL